MKNATVSARIEPDIKNEAEDILKKLGVPVSVVIDSLYRQIILTQGIPFSLSLPQTLKTLEDMSAEELNAKLQHSYDQSLSGQGRPFQDVFNELEEN